MSSKTWLCAQCAPNLVASRSPFHLAGGCGRLPAQIAHRRRRVGQPQKGLDLAVVDGLAVDLALLGLHRQRIGMDVAATRPATARTKHCYLINPHQKASAEHLIRTGSEGCEFHVLRCTRRGVWLDVMSDAESALPVPALSETPQSELPGRESALQPPQSDNRSRAARSLWEEAQMQWPAHRNRHPR